MLFRSNAAKRWPVDRPVDGGCEVTAEYPQAIHNEIAPELVWPNGYELPVDRDTFVAELCAERFGLPKQKSTPKENP